MTQVLSILCIAYGVALVVNAMKSQGAAHLAFPRHTVPIGWRWRMLPAAFGAAIALGGVAIFLLDRTVVPQ